MSKIFIADYKTPDDKWQRDIGNDRVKLAAFVFRSWPTLEQVCISTGAFDPETGVLFGAGDAITIDRDQHDLHNFSRRAQ